jgi:hypothetical protein
MKLYKRGLIKIMELIYLYIKQCENVFENVEFNFSSNYIATMKNNELLVKENQNTVKNYYGNNVNSVSMFLGKNGMGKSTLLDILGMNREDRSNETYIRRKGGYEVKSSYFILYHLYDDYFAFEFMDESFLEGKDKISNIDMENEIVQSALYKVPMGNIFELEGGVFKYRGNIITQWLENHDCKKKIEYAYITSDKYNNRISNRHREYSDEYTFERRYYIEGNNYEHLYKYFIYLKEINNDMLQEKNIVIENCIKIEDHIFDKEKEKGDYLQERKKELDKLFNLKSRIEIQMERKILKKEPQKDLRSVKEQFLHTFYAQAIEFYFLEQLVGWSEVDGLAIDVGTAIPSLEDIKNEINDLDNKLRDEVIHGLSKTINFQYEYALLRYIIENNRNANGDIDLKSVLIYTLNRVEIAANSNVNIFDLNAMLKIIPLLEELPECYFESKKKIKIRCDVNKPDKKIIELLKIYDYCYNIRNHENGSNCIYQLLNIELPKMSEGQRVFLDIVSKSVSAIYTVQEGDSLVLLIDEPDRALHPELARQFLNTLLENINKCKDRNIQIIISSHSPFIVTDILPENVYAIDMENGHRKIVNNKDTYATNIYYLLMDSFMLENTFGEYSYRQLKKIMKLLNEPNKIGLEQMKWIGKIIDRIGEKTVKKKLMDLYKEHDDLKTKLIEKISSETNQSKLIKIKELLESND